ncbi:CGNR zinc finger domain-containing protein [Nocardia aobensis]|uniref:CGNR zinc finger domain-containing protein n=1 Tax=Nocardia aobensis TaxID=257277 RepID=A0ABW6P705_9NOCA
MSEPLIGEPPALDLVNTRPADGDLLQTPEQLTRWLGLQAGRLSGLPGDATAADLAAVHAVRDHTARILEALLAERVPPAAALDGLTAAQAAAPAIRTLEWGAGGFTATVRRLGEPGTHVAAALADAAVDLLADPSVARVRRCAADDCVLLFLPAHPRRQWCSPERCGNRARVARYYQRHKGADR